MKRENLTAFAALALAFGATASAADFDGTKPVLCSVAEIYECSLESGCADLSTDQANVPAIVRIDFAKGEISGQLDDGSMRQSTALSKQTLENKLIMQGIEQGYEGERDGSGWSVAITQDSREMVLTASTDETAFVMLGSCIED